MRRTAFLVLALQAASLASAAESKQSEPKPFKTKSKWANAVTFDCTPQEGLLTSWTGQPGKPDHEDTTNVNADNLIMCRAQAAAGVPACYVSSQQHGAFTIPSHRAIDHWPSGSDILTLSCNGTAPTCCQIQIAPHSNAKAKK